MSKGTSSCWVAKRQQEFWIRICSPFTETSIAITPTDTMQDIKRSALYKLHNSSGVDREHAADDQMQGWEHTFHAGGTQLVNMRATAADMGFSPDTVLYVSSIISTPFSQNTMSVQKVWRASEESRPKERKLQ